jgi:hypothetical protein
MSKLSFIGMTASLVLTVAAASDASAQSVPGTVALYRFDDPASKDQLLTTNNRPSGPYTDAKGVIGYVFTQPTTALVPLYHYFNPGTPDHFYTTDYAELRDGAAGWGRQADTGFIYPTQVSGTVALYRYANARADHYYTTNRGELGDGNAEWTFERITGYLYPAAGGPSTPPVGGPTVTPGPRDESPTPPSGGPTVTPRPRDDNPSSGGGPTINPRPRGDGGSTSGPSVSGGGRDVTTRGGGLTLTPR